MAIENESALRHNLAWQVALERVGISPGIIDGKIGPKTQLATREFQRVRGLKITGDLTPETSEALQIEPDRVLARYTVQARDIAEVGQVPKSWVAKSKLKRLGHESTETVVAELFHCSRDLLAKLNPRRNLTKLKEGDKIVVPVVPEPASATKAAAIEINFTEKIVRVIDSKDRLVALFHCSIAAEKSKRPTGKANVVAVAQDPTYNFDPKGWPEVKEHVDGPLLIPPGPRNPVGRCWIALSLKGYGIHGTPNPELIGKTGSHGCFRLTNWDALRLSRMVSSGTPVRFVDEASGIMASAKP